MPDAKLNHLPNIMVIRSIFAVFALIGAHVPVEGATIILTVNQDAWLGTGGGFENINGGSDPYLLQDLGEADSSAGLIEFEIEEIPANAKVTKATLSLYHLWNGQPSFYLDLFQVTASWDESKVTGASAPSYIGEPVTRLLIEDADAETWRQWDVTAMVESWVAGDQPNYGLRIERRPGPIEWPFFVPWPYIVSHDGNSPFAPMLTVEYQESPEPATMLAGVMTVIIAVAGGLRARSLRQVRSN